MPLLRTRSVREFSHAEEHIAGREAVTGCKAVAGREAAVRDFCAIARSLAAVAVSHAQSGPLEDLANFPRTSLEILHGKSKKDARHFDVWIANKPARQEQGLMFVRDLPPAQGMLFPQAKPRKMNMWMKDIFIELDIVFIGEKGAIDKIIEHAKPLDLDDTDFRQARHAVLEIKGGEAASLGLKVGDHVTGPRRKAATRSGAAAQARQDSTSVKQVSHVHPDRRSAVVPGSAGRFRACGPVALYRRPAHQSAQRQQSQCDRRCHGPCVAEGIAGCAYRPAAQRASERLRLPIADGRAEPGALRSRDEVWRTHGRCLLTDRQQPLRSDVSFTIFISNPAEYEGGELVSYLGSETISFKGKPGSAVFYPSTTIHEVMPVTAGERLVIIGFIESQIPDQMQRDLLYTLREVRALEGLKMDWRNQIHLEYVIANLHRMWSR